MQLGLLLLRTLHGTEEGALPAATIFLREEQMEVERGILYSHIKWVLYSQASRASCCAYGKRSENGKNVTQCQNVVFQLCIMRVYCLYTRVLRESKHAAYTGG